MKIVLPFPAKELNPNARKHWGAVSRFKKKARADAALATRAAMGGKAIDLGEGPIPMRITFFPPDNRHRDDDNMVASFKAARDGIADALGVDDCRFEPHYFFEDAEKPGRVEVSLG